MTDPFASQEPPSAEDVAGYIDDRDRATRAASFAVDDWWLSQVPNLDRLTAAQRTRLLIAAALGYLIGEGLITVKPEEEWPEYLNMRIPGHLRPDVAEAMAGASRLAAALKENQLVGPTLTPGRLDGGGDPPDDLDDDPRLWTTP